MSEEPIVLIPRPVIAAQLRATLPWAEKQRLIARFRDQIVALLKGYQRRFY